MGSRWWLRTTEVTQHNGRSQRRAASTLNGLILRLETHATKPFDVCFLCGPFGPVRTCAPDSYCIPPRSVRWRGPNRCVRLASARRCLCVETAPVSPENFAALLPPHACRATPSTRVDSPRRPPRPSSLRLAHLPPHTVHIIPRKRGVTTPPARLSCALPAPGPCIISVIIFLLVVDREIPVSLPLGIFPSQITLFTLL